MAIAAPAFVFRSRGAGLVYGNEEDPGDLVNLDEKGLCIAACGIRSNPI
jgi:hypothetical protein